MHARSLASLSVLTLLACRPIAPSPPSPRELWDQQVRGAAAPSIQAQSESQRPEYAQGFENGAAMVRRALDTGRQPFVLLPESTSTRVPRILSTLPPDAIIESQPLAVEMDAATGLRIWDWGSALGSAYTRGQQDGFAWALSHHGQSLVKPHPKPAMPKAWLGWPERAGSIQLECPGQKVDVWWREDALLWRQAGQGFPSQRRWRSADQGWRPRFVALQGDVLWLDTSGHGAVALDLETGLVRALASSPHPPGAEAAAAARDEAERKELEDLRSELSPEATRKRWREQAQAPEAVALRKRLREASEGGNPEAMLELALNLAGLEDPEGQEAAPWLAKAADRGLAEAMSTLGAWYFEGRRVPKSRTLAKHWLEKAAAAGSDEARRMLASLFATP